MLWRKSLRQECIDLYLSKGGQRLLTNVDTGEQLWLQCSYDQYVQNQWKQNIPVEWSEVYEKNLLGKENSMVSKDLIFAASQWYMQFSNYRTNEVKMGRFTFYFKRWVFFEVKRKDVPKMSVCLMMDTYFNQRFEVRIQIITTQIKYRRSQKFQLQSEDFVKICSPVIAWS